MMSQTNAARSLFGAHYMDDDKQETPFNDMLDAQYGIEPGKPQAEDDEQGRPSSAPPMLRGSAAELRQRRQQMNLTSWGDQLHQQI